MGYLLLNGAFGFGVPDFSKAIFSFWFRVPAASIAAAKAQYLSVIGPFIADGTIVDFNMAGILPLVAFGPNTSVSVTGTGGGSSQIGPCFIGICCGDTGFGNGDGTDTHVPSLVALLNFNNGGGTVSPNGAGHTPEYTFTEAFPIGWHPSPYPYAILNSSPQDQWNSAKVVADKWHHVLISFDVAGGYSSAVSGGNTIATSSTNFWMAYDDINRNGPGGYLFPSWAGNSTNDIYGLGVACTQPYSFGGGVISSGSTQFGIPCTTDNSSFIYKVEMAEFQMYTGATLDTSVTANRRLFVSETGKPTATATAKAALTGAGFSASAKIILAGKSKNWRSGINSGDGGNFSVHGSIADYTPGPSFGA